MRAVFVLVASLLCAGAADLEEARRLYERTEFQQSLKLLDAVSQKDASVYGLTGQNYFMLGEYKKATDALEKAVSGDPNSADYALWLGRAYGRRAETSNPFSAMGLASKSRQYLERACELNPRNFDALNDLLDYYLNAPGFLGGGMDKAKATVARISQVSPAEGYYAQSRVDEKHKDLRGAEEHLRRAVELAPHEVGRFMALATFLVRQGRYQEADQSFARAEQLAPDDVQLMFARADAYVKSGRHLDLAKDLLKRYLSANVNPEDPPKASALKLLRQIEGS